jgi:Glycosyl hydrolases family 18
LADTAGKPLGKHMTRLNILVISICILGLSVLARPVFSPKMHGNAPIFVGYWGGYFNRSYSLPLDATPSYVNVVPLAFGCPMGDTLTLKFLCSQYTENEVIAAVKKLQTNGQKVIMSLIDTPSTNWNQINLVTFAQSVKNIVIDEWGLDGVDIDAESSMSSTDYVPAFVELAKEIRKAIGPDKIMTYTCYTGSTDDQSILAATAQYYDGLNLMAYFDGVESMIELFQTYAQWFDPSRITIGVQSGVTPLAEVASLSKWQPSTGPKGGMMLWTLSEDNPVVTGQPNQTWTKMIETNLRLRN